MMDQRLPVLLLSGRFRTEVTAVELDEPVTESVLELSRVVIARTPGYNPPVEDGRMTVEEWFGCKAPERAWGVLVEDELVGYVGVKEHSDLPPGAGRPPQGRPHELVRLMVHPDFREIGVASELISVVEATSIDEVFAVCVTGSESWRLFRRRGWTTVRGMWLPISEEVGSLLVPPAAEAEESA